MTINKHNEIRKNFNNEYLKVLSPLFQSLEPLRQKYVQKFFGVAFMSVFLPLTFIGLPLAFRYYFGDTEAFIQGGDFYFVTCIPVYFLHCHRNHFGCFGISTLKFAGLKIFL